MITVLPQRPPFTPRYWGGWMGIGLLWLMGKLPHRVGHVLSVPLGNLMLRLMKRRRLIAERNIACCFPEWSDDQREACLRGSFRSLARALFETALSWSGAANRLARLGGIDGLENLRQASASGRGVLLVTAHISCLEIGGRIMSFEVASAGIYRPLKSRVLEYYQTRSRLAYGQGMIQKHDVRSAIRHLRGGGNLWYAPDQDFGPSQTLFASFFGIQTATLLATVRLATLTGCAVVPMFPCYDSERHRYTVKFLPALDNFPSADPGRDLTRINAIMEAHIRTAPEQYWWIHRRFKTRPQDESPFYE